MNLVPSIARTTRFLQAKFPSRSLKGLTRFANLFHSQPYTGVVTFDGGIHMRLNNQEPAERWLLFSGNYQPAVTHFLKEVTPMNGYCLDVGANLGFYTLKMAQWVGARGHVAAFEANPHMASRVRDNIALNRFSQAEVIEAAVHDVPGELEFYISTDPGKSSIYPVRDAVRKLVVKAVTLDDFLQDWPRLDVIKMDIEGNDCLGLYGGRKAIQRFRPHIVFEYHFKTPANQSQALFELLHELKYDLRSLDKAGRLAVFDATSEQGHTDVICIPRQA